MIDIRVRNNFRFYGLLRWVSTFVIAASVFAAAPDWVEAQPRQQITPGRWWPAFRRPHRVLLAVRPSSAEEYVTLMTLSGLAARACNEGRTDSMIWVKQQSPNAYDMWLKAMLNQTGATLSGPATLDVLLKRLIAAGVVSGYITYRPDVSVRELHQGNPQERSVNVATSLCAVFHGIAVAEGETARYRALGLHELFDARTMSEEVCFERFKSRLNRRIVAMQDPKVAEARDAAVAMNAMTISMPDRLYESVLAWAEPGTPVLGWGIGDEFEIASRATRYAHFMTDTDWCTNLPLMSTETAGVTIPASRLRRPNSPALWDLAWEDNVHYVCFIMSDGDNVQWALGDFTSSTEHSWWDSSYRGKVPLGWTSCYDNLVQIGPYAQQELFSTSGKMDDFVLFGGGYFYPDLYSSSRPDAQRNLDQHARHFCKWMQFGGIRLLMFNLKQWDSDAGVRAYNNFAAIAPDLLGIFAFSYAPYTAGRGATFWVNGGQDGSTPVASVRFAVWNHASDPGQGNPGKVAAMVNAMPHVGAIDSAERFSTVMIHAWSWFKVPQAPGGDAAEVDQQHGGSPGTGRGVGSAFWCASQFKPWVRPLRPGEYMWMMRLRLHPELTIANGLAKLSRAAGRLPQLQQSKFKAKLKQAETYLHARRYHDAFEAGKTARALLDHT